MIRFLFETSWGAGIYYGACTGLWFFLALCCLGAWRQGFPEWLAGRPRLMVILLGTNRMPEQAKRTLRRFYSFLAGGWTWILIWSWWLGPMIKTFFFRNLTTPRAYEIARLSTMIVVIAYAAAGFFAIGKAVSIWFKEIYAPTLQSGK